MSEPPKPPSLPTSLPLKPLPADADQAAETAKREIPSIIELIKGIDEVVVEGVEPYDVAKSLEDW